MTGTKPKRIWIENGVLKCHGAGKMDFEIPLSQVRVIGEYSTPLAFFKDDYFLVFVTPTGTHQVSYDWVTQDNLFEHLEKEVGIKLNGSLANSADWRSLVLWPNGLKGKDLCDFDQKRGFFQRLFFVLFSGVELKLTQPVQDYRNE